VTGIFRGTATFGSTTFTSRGSEDVFVAKVDPKGKFIWATSPEETAYPNWSGIAVDSIGNIYVTGYFYVTATFGFTTLTSKGLSDAFVWKISAGSL